MCLHRRNFSGIIAKQKQWGYSLLCCLHCWQLFHLCKDAHGPASVHAAGRWAEVWPLFHSNGCVCVVTGWEGACSLLTLRLLLLWFHLDPCDSHPCQNGGTCVPEGLDKYHCLCPVGYGGGIHCGRCQPDFSLLPSQPCLALVSGRGMAVGMVDLGCSLWAVLQGISWIFSYAFSIYWIRPSDWVSPILIMSPWYNYLKCR